MEIDNLSKTYTGKVPKKALQQVSMQIGKGEFVALLGHNGAGKSTLINILAGNVKKSSGKVVIGGFDIDDDELATKRIIGIVPQEIGFEFLFTVDEVLRNQSGYFGISNNRSYISEVLEVLTLTDKRYTRVKDLSGGMKRRLLIAKALIHKPQILVLDEPTAGVDIELRHSLYGFLKNLHEKGTTIILTTHYIEEAEKLCERIIIIGQGKIVADQPKAELINAFAKEVLVEMHFDNGWNEYYLDFLSGYRPDFIGKDMLRMKIAKQELTAMLGTVIQNGIKFDDLVIERPKLEEIYLNIVNR